MNDEELKKEIHSLFGDAQATDGGYQSLYDGKWIDMTDEVCAVADFITADRKRVALEARIDELSNAQDELFKGAKMTWFTNRRVELKAQLEDK